MGEREITMSKEMIVRLNEDRVKVKGCEYVQDLIRCGECRYWQDNNGGYPTAECRWWKDETPDVDDFCSFAEPNVIERNDG